MLISDDKAQFHLSLIILPVLW